jgi:hypothetical protein
MKQSSKIKNETTKLESSPISIQNNFIWYKRLYILFKNPFTYLFKGFIEL